MTTRCNLAAVVTLVVLVGCGQETNAPRSFRPPNTPQGDASANQPPAGHPREFFPSNVGATWIYEIEVVGGDRPLKYEEVSWPIGEDKAITYATRGIIFSHRNPIPEGGKKTYTLEISVKARAEKQGRLQYPLGVELTVAKDELGAFGDAKQVFWAITESGRFTANLVVTYDPDTPGAPVGGGFGRWGQGDGSSMRLFFFTDRPGIGIGLKGSPDSLVFHGLDADVKGFEGTQCLHFTRLVEAGKKDKDDAKVPAEPARGDRLSRAFKEEMWFGRGQGLVRLEQHVDDKPTMIWKLKSFRSGEK